MAIYAISTVFHQPPFGKPAVQRCTVVRIVHLIPSFVSQSVRSFARSPVRLLACSLVRIPFVRIHSLIHYIFLFGTFVCTHTDNLLNSIVWLFFFANDILIASFVEKSCENFQNRKPWYEVVIKTTAEHML